MPHLLYALALLLLLSGACAILGEKSNLSPALLPLPVLSGAVVVLYLCGVAGFLRVGAVAVLLALAAVWVVGLVQYRPAGVAAAWKKAASVPGFTLFLGGAAFIWLLFCVQQPMFTQWDEFTAWGLAPKMVVERGAFYVADPVNLKASFTYPATSLIDRHDVSRSQYAAASLLSPWQRRNHQDPALPSTKAGPYFSN